MQTFDGQLQIDNERGVIWFHCNDPEIAEKYGSVSILRICSLPKPIPETALDITFGYGVSWSPPKKDQEHAAQQHQK